MVPSVSGPKRPHDRVSVSVMKQDFQECLTNKVGFKGFGIPLEKQATEVSLNFQEKEYKLKHGTFLCHSIFVYIIKTIIRLCLNRKQIEVTN